MKAQNIEKLCAKIYDSHFKNYGCIFFAELSSEYLWLDMKIHISIASEKYYLCHIFLNTYTNIVSYYDLIAFENCDKYLNLTWIQLN